MNLKRNEIRFELFKVSVVEYVPGHKIDLKLPSSVDKSLHCLKIEFDASYEQGHFSTTEGISIISAKWNVKIIGKEFIWSNKHGLACVVMRRDAS